ncbi:hypothetical protein VPH47_14915 [Stenotrophomonas sp. WED208]|uniref:hypothetical protein n=1 Tax=Stenotrophomonas TaxID=40323 RepID=UPI002E77178F|nr:hypothetical protein [Stenotrophomonas geniculata]
MEDEILMFQGRLALSGRAFDVTFQTVLSVDLRLKIELLSPPLQLALDLHSAMGEPGAAGESVTLEGNGRSEEVFFSDSVDVNGIHIGSGGCQVSISARSAKLSRKAKRRSDFPATRLWFRGFKSMPIRPVESSLGKVEVRGGVKRVGRDDASGFAAIYADQATNLADWSQRADELLTFLHQGLAFASGKRLQAPVLEVLCGDRWECTYFEGEGFGGSLSPIHFMNRGPFVEALVKRFEQGTPFKDALWTVVGWLHVDTPFHEARFLMSMTAVETLCERVVPKARTTLMEKEKYRPVRKRLVSIIDEAGFDPAETAVLTQRIDLANGRPLSYKLSSLRDHYQLPPTVFTDEAFLDLCRLRNALVHSGGGKGQDAWPRILFVRELLSQVIFREIGYTGPYERYLNGYASMPGAIENFDDGRSEAPVSQESI